MPLKVEITLIVKLEEQHIKLLKQTTHNKVFKGLIRFFRNFCLLLKYGILVEVRLSPAFGNTPDR